jgi:hypothetical protein
MLTGNVALMSYNTQQIKSWPASNHVVSDIFNIIKLEMRYDSDMQYTQV